MLGDDGGTTKCMSLISITALKMHLPSTKFLLFGFSNDLVQMIQTIDELQTAAGFIPLQKVNSSHSLGLKEKGQPSYCLPN